LGDPGVYVAQEGERVKVAGFRGEYRFIEYGDDRAGDYAVVQGGSKDHQRIVTVDRILSRSRRRALRKRTP
jgi:hypothetical protein